VRLTSSVVAAVVSASCFLAVGCWKTTSTCEEQGKRADCSVDQPDGGAAGNSNAGTANTAGNSAGGDSSGGGAAGGGGSNGGNGGAGATSGGAAGGEAGGGGDAGSPPCGGLCRNPKPVCAEASNTCVECVGNAQCEGTKPACDLTTNSCVECTDNTDCKDTAKPFCDKAVEQCLACLQQSDCKSPTASACDAGSCKACTKDAECSNISGKGVCDTGTCVQCTGSKFTACGNVAGTPLVCDSLKRTCSTNKQHSAGLCQACVTDAQCNAGEICVLDKFGTPAKDVGYFCHWKKGDVADGAPADCFATGQPYSDTQTNAVSIDGVTSDVCTLAVSTCVARNQFKSKDCSVSSAPSDAVCGFAPPKDSKCAQVPSSSTYRCTMTCGSDVDCPAPFTCNTGASTPVCTFN